MITTVINRQKAHGLRVRQIENLFRLIMDHARSMTRGRKWNEVSLLLTDDAGISRVNCEYLHRDGPTDVMSFRYEPLPGEEAFCGEIIVNVQRAWEKGPAYGGVSRELALYIAHGCDHLTGETDRMRRGRVRMRRRELRWLEEAGKAGLVTGLFRQDAQRPTSPSARSGVRAARPGRQPQRDGHV